MRNYHSTKADQTEARRKREIYKMRFLKNLKIAYWATFKPAVFDEFVRMYLARIEYKEKARSHKACKAEQRKYNLATARFNAVLKG